MKMTIMRGTLAATALLLSAGALAQDSAPIKTKSGTVAAAPEDKAQVVFYRTGSLVGAALGCTVREDKNQIARLGAGKYWVVNAAPGKHQYYVEGEATDRLNLELEAGETYFVRCNIGMGIVAGRPNLSPSDRAAFAKKAKGLKLWEPKGDAAAEQEKLKQ